MTAQSPAAGRASSVDDGCVARPASADPDPLALLAEPMIPQSEQELTLDDLVRTAAHWAYGNGVDTLPTEPRHQLSFILFALNTLGGHNAQLRSALPLPPPEPVQALIAKWRKQADAAFQEARTLEGSAHRCTRQRLLAIAQVRSNDAADLEAALLAVQPDPSEHKGDTRVDEGQPQACRPTGSTAPSNEVKP